MLVCNINSHIFKYLNLNKTCVRVKHVRKNAYLMIFITKVRTGCDMFELK